MAKTRKAPSNHLRSGVLAILSGIIIGCIGLYLTFQSRAAVEPPASTKPVLAGLMDRKGFPKDGYIQFNGKPLVKNYVVDAKWSDIEKTEGNFNFGSIQGQIDKATENGALVRLRIFSGLNAPTWVKDKVGSVPWEETEDDVKPYRLPKFWTSSYQTYYAKFLKRMSEKYNANPTVSEVTMAMCTTTYAEPLIRQTRSDANRTNAINAGYTYLADYSCLRNEIALYDARNVTGAGKLFANTRVSFAINPFQGFNPPAMRSKMDDTISLMNYCRERLGKRCVLGNNSIRYPEMDGNYTNIYDRQKALGGILYYQTATPSKIGDWKKTLEWAVDQKAYSVELNAGYDNYDKAQLATYARRLRANAGLTY